MIHLKPVKWKYLDGKHCWGTPFGKIEIVLNDSGEDFKVVNLPRDGTLPWYAPLNLLLFKNQKEAMDFCEEHMLEGIKGVYNRKFKWITDTLEGYSYLVTPFGLYKVKQGKKGLLFFNKPCIIKNVPYSWECSVKMKTLSKAYSYCVDDLVKRVKAISYSDY